MPGLRIEVCMSLAVLAVCPRGRAVAILQGGVEYSSFRPSGGGKAFGSGCFAYRPGSSATAGGPRRESGAAGRSAGAERLGCESQARAQRLKFGLGSGVGLSWAAK